MAAEAGRGGGQEEIAVANEEKAVGEEEGRSASTQATGERGSKQRNVEEGSILPCLVNVYLLK